MNETADKGLFLDDYLFSGSHEEKARKLIGEIDNSSGARIFSSAVELFAAAAVIGCYYKKRSKKEKGDKTLRIMQNQFTNHYRHLMFVYKLVMLMNSDLKLQPIDKINNAFRYKESRENREVFEEYMLGGVDVLYDKFFVSTNSSYDDFQYTLFDLLGSLAGEVEKDTPPIDFDDVVF